MWRPGASESSKRRAAVSRLFSRNDGVRNIVVDIQDQRFVQRVGGGQRFAASSCVSMLGVVAATSKYCFEVLPII